MLGLPSESGYLLLSPLSFGDVSRNLRCTYNLTFGTSNWRHGDRNYDQAAILALANRFTMFDALSVPDALEDCRLFILAVGWDQKRDRLSDSFFCCIAEDTACAFIPTRDDAIEGDADDCVIAALNNGGEPPKLLVTFSQRGFGSATFDKAAACRASTSNRRRVRSLG